jgi:hypothetical protein
LDSVCGTLPENGRMKQSNEKIDSDFGISKKNTTFVTKLQDKKNKLKLTSKKWKVLGNT